ncbi:32133_t:CDS:2, partial [Racocetra persica]
EPEVTPNSESYIRHKIPRFKFGSSNSNNKSSITTTWKKLKPKPWSAKKPSAITNSPEHDCSISNAWNNGILLRICCMRPDLLSFESSKTSSLIRLLLRHLTTKEPPTNITGHIILPKSITHRRDTFLQSTFSEHPELWILLNFFGKWEQTQRTNQIELDTAIRLVEMMHKAQYIPPPLNNVSRLLLYLQPKDVGYLLFESIWKFVLENWQLCLYSDDYNMLEEQTSP